MVVDAFRDLAQKRGGVAERATHLLAALGLGAGRREGPDRKLGLERPLFLGSRSASRRHTRPRPPARLGSQALPAVSVGGWARRLCWALGSWCRVFR